MDRATLYRAGYRANDGKGDAECGQPFCRHYESPSADLSAPLSAVPLVSLADRGPGADAAVGCVVCAEYDSEEVKRTLCCTMYWHEDPTYTKQCLNEAYGCDRRMHRHPLCELGRSLCEFIGPDFTENGWPVCPMTAAGDCSLAPNAHGADWYAQRELAWNHRFDRPAFKEWLTEATAKAEAAQPPANSEPSAVAVRRRGGQHDS
jgi:hypothetical protein